MDLGDPGYSGLDPDLFCACAAFRASPVHDILCNLGVVGGPVRSGGLPSFLQHRLDRLNVTLVPIFPA